MVAQVISVQTFCLLFYQLHSPRWVAWIVLGFVNGFMIMLTFLGPGIYKTKTNGAFCGCRHFSLLTAVLSCGMNRWYLLILVLDHSRV